MRVVAASYLARFDIEQMPEQMLDIRQYIKMQYSDGNWKDVLTPRVASKV